MTELIGLKVEARFNDDGWKMMMVLAASYECGSWVILAADENGVLVSLDLDEDEVRVAGESTPVRVVP